MGEKAYKGFEQGLICRGKQYAENTVFEEDTARICKKGMHYCKNPFDVLEHYDLVNSDGSFNEFAEVEAMEEEFTNDNKKFCTTKLKIGAKLGFSGFVKACVDFMIEKTIVKMPEVKMEEDENVISTDEIKAKIGSSGYSAKIGSSGDSAKIGLSGDSAQIGSSGDSAQIGSSGDSAKIGSSGYSAQIGSSGDSAKIGSSGYSAKIGSSGNYAQIGSSGDYAQIDSSGLYSVVMCAGHESIAKAMKGSFITLAEWEYNEELEKHIPINVVTEKVDGERIKENTYYKLVDGKFVEVE